MLVLVNPHPIISPCVHPLTVILKIGVLGERVHGSESAGLHKFVFEIRCVLFRENEFPFQFVARRRFELDEFGVYSG